MRGLISDLLDLLLPPCCAGCGRPASDPLCPGCHAGLAWIPFRACAGCQERPPLAGEQSCAACRARSSALDACLAACWFEGVAADWIRAYKYARPGARSGNERARLLALAHALARRAPSTPPDRVIPVPLHPARLRVRGFNPAGGLARALARERGLPCSPTALRRVRATRSQTGLGRASRARNLRGAFAATGPAPPRVWLVDDVVTTGATLEAAARALRRAGARSVVALCAARTPQPGIRSASPPSRR
jgi:ComF family protein